MREYADALKELAKPAPAGDKTKTAIGRAADAAGLGYWRAFDIWYLKARHIEDHEKDQINEALRNKHTENLESRIDRLTAELEQIKRMVVAERAERDRERAGADRRMGGMAGSSGSAFATASPAGARR